MLSEQIRVSEHSPVFLILIDSSCVQGNTKCVVASGIPHFKHVQDKDTIQRSNAELTISLLAGVDIFG